jgi:dephospho-CoA kinase
VRTGEKTPVVGLTGCPGSGKSLVASMLGKHGARIVDVDEAGRWAVDNHADVHRRLSAAFGADIFAEDGNLDRRKLGALVFADPEKLARLNEIVHPVMLDRVRRLIREAQEPDVPYIVLDAALIFELSLDRLADLTVTVDAPFEVCAQRIRMRNALTTAEIKARFRAQLPREIKRKRADYVILNRGGLDQLQRKVEKLHAWLVERLNRD